MWSSKRIPSEWKNGIVLPVYKGKGSRSSCSSYRPITLLSVPGKVFAHVLLNRIRPLLLEIQRPQQSGFTPSRSTCDAILALRILSEIHREFSRPLNVAFIDLKAAFDSVDRAQLWKLLRSKGIPSSILDLIKLLHCDTTARIRANGAVSDDFNTSSGVRQGCILAPTLFSCAMDQVLHHCSDALGVSIGEEKISDLLYADDAALFLEDPSLWPNALSQFQSEANHLGLNVSWTKTKLMNTAAGPQPQGIHVGTEAVEAVESFRYLGCCIDHTGYCSPEISRRIGMASSVMNQLTKVWSQRRLSLQSKCRLYSSLVLSVLLYGSETWTLRKTDLNRLESFHFSCQRRILKVRWHDFVSNAEVSARTHLARVTNIIAARRHSFFGHVRRLNPNVPAHKALSLSCRFDSGYRPDASWCRPCGRPRLTWVKTAAAAVNLDPASCFRLAAERARWRTLRPYAGSAD